MSFFLLCTGLENTSIGRISTTCAKPTGPHWQLGFAMGRGGRQQSTACNESLESARLEVGQADRGAPGLLGDRLLREEARSSDHAHARVRQLLLLHLGELGRVLRGEAERVEAQVARATRRATWAS